MIDTPGWISADLHVHSAASLDSRVPMRDRVLQFVADGVVSTDHNVIADYAPVILPRKQWPGGGLPRYGLSGNIPGSKRAQPGMALSVWGDAGWGGLVRSGKYDGRFDDQLVVASVALLNAWQPAPAPGWVTCIPSLRHPSLIPDFAARLAKALRLPFHAILRKTDDRPAQKNMANSSKQALNLDGSLALDGTVLTSPVLLVDDMVDSRWTLTVSAWLVLEGGSGPVFPFALAIAGGGE